MSKQRQGLPDDPKGQYVYMRLFKDIPQEDLEMMFPNTQVQLRLFDKIKLGVTAGGRHCRRDRRSRWENRRRCCSRQSYRTGGGRSRGHRAAFSPGHERFQHTHQICNEAGAKAVFSFPGQ